ncbi:RNA-binding protein LARP/SRO9 [Handroanthus impetiginosus]|uniref:RNA-binding protein LARP/SRO9 n=1 Tax=Handroanthus impetiginosus TaxID=429701 RepID=A0A2G9GFN8_9LAMI|nr:RNA-binding protein LARP/SRO9 [Handroanthus impetiginosus]
METENSPTTADVASNGGGVNSPQSRRRSLPSPWASVVRGDSEPNSSPTAAAAAAAAAAPGSSSSPPAEQASASDNSLIESSGSEAQPESSDVNGDSNAGRLRRPAWNRPLNGAVEPASVMGGAVSWPALSETTRPISRSPSDTLRPVSDGSVSSSQAPIISQPPQRPANNNAHANSTINNPMPTRPRPRNRNGGGGGGSSSGSGSSQNAFNQPHLPMPLPYPIFELPLVPPVMDASVRGGRPVGGGGGSQSHNGTEHSAQRNNSRRGGYGPRPRGDGAYHNNHGGRRDQDRRDVHHPPQYIPPPMGYMPPPLPPGAAPFMGPMRILPGQMGFDMASQFFYVPTMPPESYRAMPIVPPPPPPMPFSPVSENSLNSMIVRQIDFYFSDENLVKDNFLRSKMDDHGWVPIALIASFRRVQQLTKDIPVIVDALRYSTVVEVQGDKVRRHNEWKKWLLPSARHSEPGSHTPGAAPENALATSLQNVSLDDGTINSTGNTSATEGHTEKATGNVSSEELTGHSGLPNGENAAEEAHSI